MENATAVQLFAYGELQSTYPLTAGNDMNTKDGPSGSMRPASVESSTPRDWGIGREWTGYNPGNLDDNTTGLHSYVLCIIS